MHLLAAHRGDPAGLLMARRASQSPECGRLFEVRVLDAPAVSADRLEGGFEACIFLSRHEAASGRLALTCHSTGNFGQAGAGGRDREVALPYPSFQRHYMRRLHGRRADFAGFEITIEATHHGPTGLGVPSVFVEVGTGPEQWNDGRLCSAVADTVVETLRAGVPEVEYGVCFGGTHYPGAFTRELISGARGLGTVVPRRALPLVDEPMLDHIIHRNRGASCALLDWSGMGAERRRIAGMLEARGIETARL